MALISKASLLMVPSTYEAGKLYNVLPSGNRAPDNKGGAGYDQTRADFDFDRGSNAAATRIGSDGLLKKYQENLLLQSNQFDTTWTTGATLTSGQSGYNGNNAWKFASSSGGQTGVQQSVSFSNIHTFSVYAKVGSVDFIKLFVVQSGTNRTCVIDLSDGSIANDNSVSASSPAASVTSLANGWYRIEMPTNANSATFVRIRPHLSEGDDNLSVGDYIYIQSTQLETGLAATDVLTSGATTAKAGVLIDLPRINYDANGENGSLLLEPSRQQLFQFSEYFADSYWAKTGSGSGVAPIVTQNHAISPEGLKNASRVQFDTNGSSSGDRSGFVRDFAFTTGDKYAISCWVKSASGSDEIFTFRIAGAQVGGEKTATSEWQLFTETHTATATTTDNFGIQIRGNYSSQTSDILIYAMQLEPNATYATSYIPNHGTSGGVTRAADSCSVTGASDVIGQTEGTLFVDLDLKNTTSLNGNYHILILGPPSQRITIYSSASVIAVDGTGSGGFTAITTPFTAGRKKIAVAYASNDIAFYINGVLIGTKTTASIPTPMGQIDLGGNYTYSNYIAGNEFNQTALFKERLSNAELATLTTL